jgi:hypothetical protein
MHTGYNNRACPAIECLCPDDVTPSGAVRVVRASDGLARYSGPVAREDTPLQEVQLIAVAGEGLKEVELGSHHVDVTAVRGPGGASAIEIILDVGNVRDDVRPRFAVIAQRAARSAASEKFHISCSDGERIQAETVEIRVSGDIATVAALSQSLARIHSGFFVERDAHRSAGSHLQLFGLRYGHERGKSESEQAYACLITFSTNAHVRVLYPGENIRVEARAREEISRARARFLVKGV